MSFYPIPHYTRDLQTVCVTEDFRLHTLDHTSGEGCLLFINTRGQTRPLVRYVAHDRSFHAVPVS
jgi:hypothetical protein